MTTWFEPVLASARVEDHPYGARSPRERKAIEDGLPVFRLRYRNGSAGVGRGLDTSTPIDREPSVPLREGQASEIGAKPPSL